MCYAIPGRVIKTEGKTAVVDYFGESRTVLNEFSNAKKGDYVYAQGGILIDKISEEEAIPILKEWKNKFFRLKNQDLKISNSTDEAKSKNKKLNQIIEKAQKGHPLRKDEIITLLKLNDKKEMKLLFDTANKLRQKYLKNSCCVHGIIEFSNYCRNNCSYCGIRRDNIELTKYRMNVDEIVKLSDYSVNKLGFKALVLQSGEDMWYTNERLDEIIRRIKERCGVLLFMSIGGRELDCYKKMYDAGARGILLRFETSNSDIYKKIHSIPKKDFKKRIEILKYSRKLGYIITTGFIIGLPNQTEEDLMNDILITKSIGAEMYSFGPLIPHPQTPFKKNLSVDISKVLKVIAVTRLLDPNAKILVTTALETLNKKEGRKSGLLAGANSLMINITPKKYRDLYSIYPDRAGDDKEVEENIGETLNLLYSLGRAPTDLGI